MIKLVFFLSALCLISCDGYNARNTDCNKITFEGHSYIIFEYPDYGASVLHDPNCCCYGTSTID